MGLGGEMTFCAWMLLGSTQHLPPGRSPHPTVDMSRIARSSIDGKPRLGVSNSHTVTHSIRAVETPVL